MQTLSDMKRGQCEYRYPPGNSRLWRQNVLHLCKYSVKWSFFLSSYTKLSYKLQKIQGFCDVTACKTQIFSNIAARPSNLALQIPFKKKVVSHFVNTKIWTPYYGCAMAQALSLRPPTAEAWVRSQVSPCGICGGQSGTGTGFSPRVFRFSPVNFIPLVLHY
jgi:hypothetical protein